MGRIPDETIQTIRDRVDIADLVGRTVTLRKAGRTWKGLCPFHEEKTPSFVVTPERGTFHCFGCGEGGNAFGFLMRHENLTFPEAVRVLAAEVGVVVPESGGGDSGRTEQILHALDLAQAAYRKALAHEMGGEARRYLQERGLDDETIEHFGLGFAPDRWDAVAGMLERERIPAAIGAAAGLLRERSQGNGHYDLLRGRITFPIQDVRGRVIAFGGRALGPDQEPKYLNSPETPVFRKRESFYGFPFALEPVRRADRVIAAEGYFDAIALHRAGVAEAIATCGTALSEDHGRNLRRRTRNVVLVFDGDEAGRKAMLRALPRLLPEGLRVRAAALPAGDDPDTYRLREGDEALRRIVDEARSALDLAIEDAVSAGCNTPERRADAVSAVVPLLAAIPDPTERSGWAERLALATGARVDEVQASVRAVARGAAVGDAVRVTELRKRGPEDRHVIRLLSVLLEVPAAAQALPGDAFIEQVPEDLRRLMAAVEGLCRKHDAASLMGALENELLPEDYGIVLEANAQEAPACEDEAHARRAVGEIAAWFERRYRRERQRSLTERLRRAAPEDTQKLLQEKMSPR